MIEIVNGRIFIDAKETTDPTYIGYALIDFAENNDKLHLKLDSEALSLKEITLQN